jgi:rRNA maturation RNase YbeY
LSHSESFRLTISARIGAAYAPYLRRYLPKARKLIKSPLRELSVALVNDRQMADLHQRFMNIPGPTDVLTFPIDQDKNGRPITGEVIVCVPYARRQAKENGVPLRDELLLYTLHGMLHLAGFDDRTESDFKRMHRTEDAILARLGVGKVFYRQKGDSARGDR